MRKRTMATLLCLVMVFACLAMPAYAAAAVPTFADVPATHWAYESVESVYEKGVMTGTTKGFEPEATLTRAEVMKIAWNAYGVKLPDKITDKVLADVPADAWYHDVAYWMAANGVINGSVDEKGNTLVYPNAAADRKYVALVLSRISSKLGVELPKTNASVTFPDIGELGTEYQNSIGALQQAGVISGFLDGTYQPNGTLTRAQAAKIFDAYTDIEGLELTAATQQETTTPPATTNFLSIGIYDEVALHAESLGYICDKVHNPQNDSWSMTFTKAPTLVSFGLFSGYDCWRATGYKAYGHGSPEQVWLYSVDDIKAFLEKYAN